MQELGRWCLIFNPEDGLEAKYQSGGLQRRYVPRMPAGLELLYKMALLY